ncbi:hypothetical protein GCK72_022065 [Caenorhabditis remanei]|uniref:Uncharacterized protein n=1 Tax=Caenorhabditis remanei TaxID=31234 RepID=A0A6A5FSR1_CAERE|nr:hypothetical protein GCK72_022065 [Caenorhabditis remanei]KAF1745618.1 hypothetical protein GCK72_022065 [Caenorhabditis remanei]
MCDEFNIDAQQKAKMLYKLQIRPHDDFLKLIMDHPEIADGKCGAWFASMNLYSNMQVKEEIFENNQEREISDYTMDTREVAVGYKHVDDFVMQGDADSRFFTPKWNTNMHENGTTPTSQFHQVIEKEIAGNLKYASSAEHMDIEDEHIDILTIEDTPYPETWHSEKSVTMPENTTPPPTTPSKRVQEKLMRNSEELEFTKKIETSPVNNLLSTATKALNMEEESKTSPELDAKLILDFIKAVDNTYSRNPHCRDLLKYCNHFVSYCTTGLTAETLEYKVRNAFARQDEIFDSWDVNLCCRMIKTFEFRLGKRLQEKIRKENEVWWHQYLLHSAHKIEPEAISPLPKLSELEDRKPKEKKGTTKKSTPKTSPVYNFLDPQSNLVPNSNACESVNAQHVLYSLKVYINRMKSPLFTPFTKEVDAAIKNSPVNRFISGAKLIQLIMGTVEYVTSKSRFIKGGDTSGAVSVTKMLTGLHSFASSFEFAGLQKVLHDINQAKLELENSESKVPFGNVLILFKSFFFATDPHEVFKIFNELPLIFSV